MNILNCSTNIGQLLKGVNKTPSIIEKNIKKMEKFKNIKFHNVELINEVHIKNTKMESKFKFHKTFYNAKNIYYCNYLNLNDSTKLNINIGGDHSISLGSVAASIEQYKDNLFVIWFDAHADINSFELSKSKNSHGMPLYYLTKSDSYIYEDWLYDNQLKYENLLYIGIRDLDEYEITTLNDNKIANIDMKIYSQLHQTNLEEHFKDIKQYIGDKKIHLSIDVDGLDPNYIPCTGTPVKNGIDLNYLLELIKFFRKDLVNVDLVELNLELGSKSDQIKSLENFLKILNTF